MGASMAPRGSAAPSATHTAGASPAAPPAASVASLPLLPRPTRVEALHLQEKLQKAGYKSKVAKWDSDSESDESDDSQEDLKA